MIVDRAGYEVFDTKNKQTAVYKDPSYGSASTSDLVGSDSMTDRHFGNLIDAIRTGTPLRQPVAQGNVSVTLMQLANISYFTGRPLHLDATTGSIKDDAEAERMTRRTYEQGWEPKV